MSILEKINENLNKSEVSRFYNNPSIRKVGKEIGVLNESLIKISSSIKNDDYVILFEEIDGGNEEEFLPGSERDMPFNQSDAEVVDGEMVEEDPEELDEGEDDDFVNAENVDDLSECIQRYRNSQLVDVVAESMEMRTENFSVSSFVSGNKKYVVVYK